MIITVGFDLWHRLGKVKIETTISEIVEGKGMLPAIDFAPPSLLLNLQHF